MNKLRDKFIGQTRVFSEERGWQDDLESAIECEQITDDFSVKLIEWLNENADFFHGENQYHFDNKWYTTTELQQYFKENIYGKE